MLWVNAKKGLSPDKLAAEHTEFRMTHVSANKCRLVIGGMSCPYDDFSPHDESMA